MKRTVAALTSALVLAIGATGTAAQIATPDLPDGPLLALYVNETGHEASSSAKVGDACPLYWNPGDYWWLLERYQIIVRNESNVVISATTVEPTYHRIGDDPHLYCGFEAMIPLQESEFYLVFLNDDYVVTYTQDSLPSDPDRPLFIDVGDSPFG